MSQAKENYEYNVVEGDSLNKIADKHNISPTVDGARKLWEHEKNQALHTEATRQGRKISRQIHMGNNKYERYNHSKYAPGYRGYDKPDQIILYAGEKIWIPENQRIRHEITDDELINGFIPEHGKKYELIFPAIKVIIQLEDGTYSKDDKYILTGTDETGHEGYKKTLIVRSDAIENNGIKHLEFNGTPKKYLYTLRVEPGSDSSGNKPKEKILYEKRPYNA